MSDFVNKVKTADGTAYDINDSRIPAPTPADAGKILGVNPDGTLAYVAGGGPTPSEPPVKGDIIVFGGHRYRVLEADGLICKVFCLDVLASNWYSSSPSSEQQVEFDDGTTGIKYEGSNLDIYCNETFLGSLSEDIQEAIIAQDAAQDILNTNASEGDEDLLITGGTFGMTYRIKKLNTESVSVGSRKIHNLSFKELLSYFRQAEGTVTITNDDLNDFFFGFSKSCSVYGWLSDANSTGVNDASYVGGFGGVSIGGYGNLYLPRPAFQINLEGINWSK